MSDIESQMLEGVESDVTVSQERLTLRDGSRDDKLYVGQSRSETPLGTGEEHIQLRLYTENGEVEIGLDGRQMDSLIDTLYNIQENYRND